MTSGSLDCGFTSEVIPICHFFGTRQVPVGLQASIHLGEVTTGPSSFPFIASLKQIHSTRVAVFDSPVKAEVMAQGEGDALVTNQPQLLLVVRTADCVPVLLVDHKIGVIGAIHAGWRGAVGGIVPKPFRYAWNTLAQMRPTCMWLLVLRSAPVVMKSMPRWLNLCKPGYPDWLGVLQETTEGKAMLDLKKLIWHQILASGISEQQIERIEECTRCRDDLFFSYRREGKVNGTMMSGIMLPER